MNKDDETRTAGALREILKLYDFEGSKQTQSIIQSIAGVRYKRGVARVPGEHMGILCHGIDVEIEFDATRFSQNGLYLLNCVLDKFISLYCSMNSFTRLTTTLKGEKDIWKKWPARSGNRLLL